MKCKNGTSINEVLASNGNPSILYKNLVSIYEGDTEKAYHTYLKTYTKEFKDWFGDWEVIAEARKHSKDIKGIYSQLLLEDTEEVLYEIAVQSSNKKNAVNTFGETLVNLAKSLHPEAKVGKTLDRKVSKALDENGEPVVVFYGTSTKNTMDNFKFNSRSYSFTDDFEQAKEQSKKFFFAKNHGASVVYPMFLNIKKNEDGKIEDGEYTVKGLSNIKSVENNGEFSKDNNDIYYMPSISNAANYKKYTKFINERQARISRIGLAITAERNQKPRDEAKIERLQNRIEEIKQEVENYEKKITLDIIKEAGVKDIAEISDLIARGNFSIDELEAAYHAVNLWLDADNILFTPDELALGEDGRQSENVRMFTELVGQAARLKAQLDIIQQDLVTKQVQSSLNISLEAARQGIKKDYTDIGSLTSLFRDISSFGNLPLSALDVIVRKASFAANQEFIEFSKNLSRVMKDVKEKDFDLMLQEDEKGNKTGLFVTRYSNAYQMTRRSLRQKAESSGDYSEYIKWLREETSYFDVNKLFYVNDDGEVISKENKEHTKELIDQLGEELYKEYLEKQKNQIEIYVERKQNYREILEQDENLTPADVEVKMDEWDKSNSPFIWTSHLSSPEGHAYKDSQNRFIKLKGYRYTQSFPKKNKNGVATKWWDSKFEKLEANKPLHELQKLAIKTINNLMNYLPENKVDELEYNTIPVLKKNLLELFKGKEGAAFLVGLRQELINSVTGVEDSQVQGGRINPITGKPENSLKVGMLDFTSDVEKAYKLKIENYMLDNNIELEEDVPAEELNRMLEESKNEFINSRSFDIPKVLIAFASMSLNFKHKSKVEGAVKLIQSFVYNSLESYETQDGKVKVDRNGNPILAKGALNNLKDALDHYVDVFFGAKSEDKTLTSKKILNSKEKELSKKYDDKLAKLEEAKSRGEIEEAKYKFELNLIKDKKDKLGRNVSMQNVGKAILKYNQLKGMGWNAFAGITNLVYGWISNAVHASGEEDFTLKDLRKAKMYSLFFSKEPKTRNKIFNLMRKFDVLKESSEAHTMDKASDKKKFMGWQTLSPYQLQKSSDYTVQSELLLALMFNTKVTDLKGNERNLYEAFDDKGEWKLEEFGENNDWNGDINDTSANKSLFALKAKSDQLVKKLHANVDPLSPILIKKSVLGRMLMQFRSWVPEGFASRFEKEKEDYLLGRVKKGRIRSMWDLKDKDGNKIDSPLYTSVAATLGSMLNIISLNLLNKGVGSTLSKVDRANLRKNAYELISYIGLYCLVAGLKGMDDDDEDREAAINYMINQGFRIQQDILFYTSPAAFENIADNAIPLFSIVTDTTKWFDSVGGLIAGEDTYEKGIYAGESKFKIATAKMLPFGTQVVRNIGAAQRVINK